MNALRITASLIECQPLRYTPAGIPVLDLVLDHQSEVTEAGGIRKVSFTVPAIALGDLALMLADLPLGTSLRIEGFLAPVRKGSRRLRIHLQHASPMPVSSGAANCE